MKPQIIDDVTFAFPASVSHLMPSKDEEGYEIYRKNWANNNSWGFKLFDDWFYNGLKEGAKFYPKEGIDSKQAIRHIRTIMASFEPSHEDKIAACAFLIEYWFDKVEYESKKSL